MMKMQRRLTHPVDKVFFPRRVDYIARKLHQLRDISTPALFVYLDNLIIEHWKLES